MNAGRITFYRLAAVATLALFGCGGGNAPNAAVPQLSNQSACSPGPCLHALSTTSVTGAVARSYAVADLGTLGGNSSAGQAINGTAQVTGYASAGSGAVEAFVSSGGHMKNLGTLGGSTGLGNGINAGGIVAGYATNSRGTYRAFVSSGTGLKDIGDLGGGQAVAYALNDLGQIVGSSVTRAGDNDPFVYKNGIMTDLGTLGARGSGSYHTAQGINNAGQIVGTSYNALGNFLAVLWTHGKIQSLGTLGGDWSQAFAINGKGQVTGQAYTRNNLQAHAFLWSAGRMADLGTLPSSSYSAGYAINSSGTIVGRADLSTGGTLLVYHAFVYNGTKMLDLNTMIPPGSHWVLDAATGINDAGLIAGYGELNGQQRAYLLTPH
ncbi:MAG: HAF repeat-containing protein [Candidatus Eremiobacteraeota bacterium]|nr:HAF repeat-containing protein [Candidatus Eremiobacteraeota bacterium]